MVGPEPLLLCLGALGVLVALFVSAAASGDVYESLLWYQSPRIWVCVSMVGALPSLFERSAAISDSLPVRRRSASAWA